MNPVIEMKRQMAKVNTFEKNLMEIKNLILGSQRGLPLSIIYDELLRKIENAFREVKNIK